MCYLDTTIVSASTRHSGRIKETSRNPYGEENFFKLGIHGIKEQIKHFQAIHIASGGNLKLIKEIASKHLEAELMLLAYHISVKFENKMQVNGKVVNGQQLCIIKYTS